MWRVEGINASFLEGLGRLLGRGDIWSRPWRRMKSWVVGRGNSGTKAGRRSARDIWGNNAELVLAAALCLCWGKAVSGAEAAMEGSNFSQENLDVPGKQWAVCPTNIFAGGKQYIQIGDLEKWISLTDFFFFFLIICSSLLLCPIQMPLPSP